MNLPLVARLRPRRTFSILAGAAFCAAAGAQETVWQSIGDPGGNGGVTFTSIHPASGAIFTGSDMSRSIFRSLDQADHWQSIANPVTGTPDYIAGDPSNPGTVYMVQGGTTSKGTGLWKSTDNGDHWTLICQSNKFGKSNCHSGVIDPADPKVLYWTGADKGVMRSSDGGITWADWSNGLPKEKLKYTYAFSHTLELDHTSPSAQRRIFYPTSLGLYQASMPSGEWRLTPGLPEGVCSDVEVCDRGVIYAAFPKSGLFMSTDGGTTWARKDKGLGEKKIIRVVATNAHPEIVYVSTDGDIGENGSQAIYGSRDRAETFTCLTDARFHEGYDWPLNYRQEEGVSARELFIDPKDPNTVYVVRGMKTTDGGKTWHHYGMKEVSQDRWQGTGLALLTQYRVVFDPNRQDVLWLGFSDTGLMLSEDGGKTIVNAPTYHRGEVNQAAGYRDKLVRSSGSAYAIAVDPDLSTTVYSSINGKSILTRGPAGGIVIKTVDGGWNWRPIYEKNGLDDGIVTAIVIDPDSPTDNRSVYVASFHNGIYKSTDDGRTFHNTTPAALFNGNRRVMALQMAPSDSRILYMGVGGTGGVRPIYSAGAGGYLPLKPGMYGGVYRSNDGGETWKKCNQSREIPSVQELAVDPTNPSIVYAAAYSEEFLVDDHGKPEWRQGGVYKSADGGTTWNLVFASPSDATKGKGEVQGICMNPVMPQILYAVVENHGVFATYDGGKTWQPLGQASMDRKQRRFHSIELNPHNPAEVWVAHFGTAFSKGIDYRAKRMMGEQFLHANFLRDPGFEASGQSGLSKNWKIEQPPAPAGEKPVVSVTDTPAKEGKFALQFNLTRAYSEAPSTLPALRELRKLEVAGAAGKGRAPRAVSAKAAEADDGDEGGGGRATGETATWIYQKVNPYFTTLARGKKVAIEMDVFIAKGSTTRPQAYVSEARDYNVHWVVAETYLEDLESQLGKRAAEMKGQWYHVRSTGTVSQGAHYLRVTVSGVPAGSAPMEAYVDNVKLSLAE
jgi:photosystem II stability/assembly factor-like uncharacterized protein